MHTRWQWPWQRPRRPPRPGAARKRADQLHERLARIAQTDDETEAMLADLRAGDSTAKETQ